MNDFEKIALAKAQKNFAQYRIIFALPEGKKFSYLPQNAQIIYFQNEDFLPLLNYKNLLLGKSFYKKVFDCESALIFKLDSFVPKDENELFLLKSYINCFENIFQEFVEEVPTEKISEPKHSEQKISSAKNKKSSALRNNPAELKNYLLKVAIDRLNYRLDKNLPIMRYLPKKYYSSVIVINRSYPKYVYEKLRAESFYVGSNAKFYDASDLDKLIQDVKNSQNNNHLFITTGIGDDKAIASTLLNSGVQITDKMIFFNAEYVESCKKILKNLSQPTNISAEKNSGLKDFAKDKSSVSQKNNLNAFRKVKKVSAPRNNPVELRNWLLKYAIERLNRRLNNSDSLRRYIPERVYTAIRILDRPYPNSVWQNLRFGRSYIGDKTYFYSEKELENLIRDLKKSKYRNNLIITTGIGDDNAIKQTMEQNKISVTDNFVFFNTAYINYWENFLKRLGKK